MSRERRRWRRDPHDSSREGFKGVYEVDTLTKLAQAWAEDPDALTKDLVEEMSDVDWSALMVRLIESLPSAGAEDEQVLRLDALRRLIGMRGPLPDQPALIAMRRRFRGVIPVAAVHGGRLDMALDVLIDHIPPPPGPAASKLEADAAREDDRLRRAAEQDRLWLNLHSQNREFQLKKTHPFDRNLFLPFSKDHDASIADVILNSVRKKVEARRTRPDRLGKAEKKATSVESKPRSWLAAIEQEDRFAPLEIGSDYVVAIDIGATDQPHLAAGQFQEQAFLASTSGRLDLTVQVSSNDFDIRSDPVQSLEVPPEGATAGPARFVVGARRAGPCTLTATVHSGGNFITLLHFTVWAVRKGGATLTVVGRPPESLTNLEPRDISLTLERNGRDAGYNCHIIADGGAAPPAYLAITPEGLAKEVDALQKALMEVVKMLDGDGDGREVFQASVQIPEEYEGAALRMMAHAGARLFRELFFGDSSGRDSQELGSYLRDAASDKDVMLTLQIVDNEAPIPWALLYVGEVHDDARLEWDKFLGLRHLIEQLPLAELGPRRTKAVPSDPTLTVGLNVNLNVDPRLTVEVAEHQARWAAMVEQRTRLKVTSRNSSAKVLKSLASKRNRDQIVYFYCHATSKGIDGDTGKATITIEPDVRMTLEELKRNAGRDIKLAGHPLVFINACESADLTPLFYTGFVPYFMSKGARGVIGTQCKTPALLAIKCAEMFFDRLLDGQPVGESMLETRRELLDVYRNPLGLLYAVHCDMDTLIAPPLLVKTP